MIRFIFIILLSIGCVQIPEDPNSNVFIPKEVEKIQVENGLVTICKENIYSNTGEALNKFELIKGETQYSSVFAHFWSCIETKEPFQEYNIPAKIWYNSFDKDFKSINYLQFRLKHSEPDFLCEHASNVECKDILNRIEKIDEFILKEE